MLADAIRNQNLTIHKLALLSGVSYSTLNSIAHDKIALSNCSYHTVSRLANALGVSPDLLVQTDTFRHYRDQLHAQLHSEGVKEFMLGHLRTNTVIYLYRAGYTCRALYLMCLLDYLCRLMNVPLIKEYDFLRKQKLSQPLQIAEYQSDSLQYIPEFKAHNILEGDVFDAT